MEPKDNLERFIKSHRAEFERQQPDPRIWDRLESALDSTNLSKPAPGRIRRLFTGSKRWVAIAATGLLCISLAAFVRAYQVEVRAPERYIPQDLREAAGYYEQQMSVKVARIKKLAALEGADSTIWEAFVLPDSEYDRLRKAVSENPGEPHVRSAFIEFYRSRLEVLTRVEAQLEARNKAASDTGN